MNALLALALLAPPLPTVSEVTQHLDDLYRSKGSHGVMSMHVKTTQFERTMKIESWSRGEDLALMVIRAPAREAGTATLRTKEGLWNYAPRADRLLRIPSGLLSDSWMGSHFTNDDLMRESSYDDDYTTSLEWHEEGGKTLLKLVLVPNKDAAVVYTKLLYYVTAEGWIPVRVEYYDEAEVVRRMDFSDVKEFSGRKIPSVLEIRPSDKPEEFTRVVYESLDLTADVPERSFSPRGLRRLAQSR